MALRINLYHEFIRARKQQQYDPLKITLLGLLVIAVCMVGYYFLVLSTTNSIKSKYATKDAEFRKLNPLAKVAVERETEMSEQIALAEKLTKRMEERFFWAPVLEQITVSVPRNVQIDKLTADVAADGERKCQIQLNGIAAGEEPRQVAEDLRKILSEKLGQKYKGVSALFKNLDDGAESVTLDNRKLRTAQFSISLSFNGAIEPATPETAAHIARQP